MKNDTHFSPKALLAFQFLLIVMTCSTGLSAQWMRQYPVPKMEWVLDIDVSMDGYGYAVGGDDMILKLDPTSQTWSTLTTPDNEWTLNAVDYLDGTMGNVVVAGGQGVIVSFNGGNTWNQIPGAPGNIYVLKALSINTLVVIAYDGVYLFQNNQWTNLDLPVTELVIGGSIIDGDHIWCYTEGNTPAIYRTSNGGNDWHVNTQLDRPDVVRFFNTTTGIAFDARTVYRSANGGTTWEEVSHNTIHNSVRDFAFGPSENVIMAVTFNDPTISTDGGLTWNQLDLNLAVNDSYSISAVSDQEFWIGNDLSSIAHSADAGETWVETSGPVRGILYNMYFADRDNGFAGGWQGEVLRTTNGGGTWERSQITSLLNITSIHGTSVSDVWIGGNQRLFHSGNGGDTWDEILMLPTQGFNDIYAADANLIMAATSGGLIMRSDNGGATWDTVFAQPGTQLRSVTRIIDDDYYVTGFNGLLLKSADNGLSWNPITPPSMGHQYEETQFIGEEGWLVSSSFVNVMWHTTNGGDTWEDIALPIDRFWDGVFFMSPDTGIVVCRANQDGRAYITFDGGANWQSSYQKPFSFHGVTGIKNPDGIAWLYGYGSNIEVLPFCEFFPGISNFQGDSSPCEGDTVQYSVNGNNIDEYHWLFPSGWEIISESNNDTVTVKIGPGFGVITVYGSNSCGTTNPMTIQAGAILLPEMISIDGPLAPCEAELRTYIVTASEAQDFVWTFPGINWDPLGNTNSEQVQVFVGEEAGVIVVEGINGCGNDFIELQVNPAMRPRMHSVTGPQDACKGDTLIYVSEPEFALEIVWTYPVDWNVVGQTDEAVISLIAGENSGIISVHALNDCGMSAIQELAVNTVIPSPISVVVNGNSLSLSASGVSYQWYLNGIPIGGAISSIHIAGQSGTYHCVVTDQNGCKVTTDAVEVIVSAVYDVDGRTTIVFYPNPAQDKVTVITEEDIISVDLLSLDGRILRQYRNTTQLDVSKIADGIYVLRFTMENEFRYGRVQVMRE